MSEITENPDALPVVADDQNPLGIIAAGVAAGTASAEAAQILQSMLYRDQDREARRAYFEALSAFQAECPPIVREKSAGNYKYSPIEAIASQTAPLLRKHGFSYHFTTELAEQGTLVTCHLTHVEGHSESSPVLVPRAKLRGGGTDVQEAGATITYGKRYSYLNATGIMTADQDTDGVFRDPPGDPVTASQAADLQALAEEVGADEQKFLRWARADSWAGIPASKLEACVRALEAKRRAQGASTDGGTYR